MPEFLFNKAAGLRPATLLKKRLSQVFSCEFCEISENTFFTQTPLVVASAVRKFGIYIQHVPYSVLIILWINLFSLHVQPCQDTFPNFRKTQCEGMGTAYYEDKLLNWTFNKNMSGMLCTTKKKKEYIYCLYRDH